MRSLRPLALAVAATLATVGCTSTSDGVDDVPAVAAVVDGEEIPSERISRIADLQTAGLGDGASEAQGDARRDAERRALSAEIQLTAVESATEERFGLDIPDEDVDEALAAQIEAQGGQEAFDELAADSGLSSEEALEFARENAYVNVLVRYIQDELAASGDLDDDALRARYEAAPEAYQSSEVRHILVDTEPEAQAVLARLDAGEDFGALAEELSNDPGSAANGGALGEAPRGSYVPPFSEAIYSEDTEIGEVVGPVESQFGFHVLIVDARTTPDFEDVRAQLEAQVVGELFNEFLDEVFAGTVVEVDPYYGRWDADRRAVVPAVVEDDAGAEGDGSGDEG